jgi:polar amino acid transport system substrate-binding protein
VNIRNVGLLVLVLSGVAACDLPRDARGTLARVTNHQIKVGVVHAPPWVVDSGDGVGGVEGDFVHDLAADLNARIEWVRQPESALLEAVHEGEIDLVIGGLKDDLPWVTEVAFTRPYQVEKVDDREIRHVLAVPPGENAWLVSIDRHLYSRFKQ